MSSKKRISYGSKRNFGGRWDPVDHVVFIEENGNYVRVSREQVIELGKSLGLAFKAAPTDSWMPREGAAAAPADAAAPSRCGRRTKPKRGTKNRSKKPAP